MDLREIKKYTSTEFMYSGGASFETHVARKTNSVFKFLPSVKFAFYTVMYLLLSVGAYYFGMQLWPIDNGLSIIGFLLLGACLVCFCAFLYFLKDYLIRIVFSKKLGYYYKGYVNIKYLRFSKTNLEHIVAIQILGEITTEQIAPFNSYEINLVLKDSERLHVIDHSNLNSIIEDAQSLSTFLNVPIWTNET
ncbi:hypothetical protein [uncultured Winogradskyella sp.]|uniref:hypothetical protein n=1 Tax=uncultured Winogradskyella sp. TaxID=395353 RepID=UPI002636A698|nr:hypothetical protein [uncultured Winogradskyella sp.]